MSSRYKTPPLLEPYLQLPPEQSLILLTGTLECSANWLTARFAGRFITHDDDDDNNTSVVLASFSRDEKFWRAEILRSTGIDPNKPPNNSRITFIDLLSPSAQGVQSQQLDRIEASITASIQASIDRLSTSNIAASTRKVYLVVDAVDLAVLVGQSDVFELLGVLHRLRSRVSGAVVTCSADSPFTMAAASVAASVAEASGVLHQPIAAGTASLLSSLGHSARLVIALRPLDTGAARDVSGVLRVTRGGGFYALHGDDDRSTSVDDLEALYLVRRDGSVDVFGQRSSR